MYNLSVHLVLKVHFLSGLEITPSPVSYTHLVPILSRFAKNGRKKSSKSFSDLLLHVPLWGSGDVYKRQGLGCLWFQKKWYGKKADGGISLKDYSKEEIMLLCK